jgi:hypothetical protein
LTGLGGGQTMSYTEANGQIGHPRRSDFPRTEAGGLTGPGGGQTARGSLRCPGMVFSRRINTQ